MNTYFWTTRPYGRDPHEHDTHADAVDCAKASYKGFGRILIVRDSSEYGMLADELKVRVLA